jgi:iron complex outermembrane receptor protein
MIGVMAAGYPSASFSQSQSSDTSLPAVTIDAPQQRAARAKPAARPSRATRTTRRSTVRNRSQQTEQSALPQNPGAVERGNGPIRGYVAGRSLSGTKTDTPLLETPQAISVVGREQMRDQNAQTVVQALQYSAGVATNQSPNDTRFESLRIRGFQPVLYLDGMQLPYGASQFGQPKIDPFLLERIDVLKGPSSSLYGQVAPGGMVNMISLLPTATPVNSIEFMANNWGRAQVGFDIGGVADPKGEWLYRIAGVVHGGGTQVDYVDDFRGAIAPSFTWRPNVDTTLTVMAGYQRDVTGLAFQFFPAQGTLLPNPNGRVPYSRFVGEPGFDHFDRTQYWAGYQFEHHLDEVWTLRQNLRYTGLDTNTYAVAGAGALGGTALQGDLRTLNRGAFSFPEDATAFTMDNQAEARFSTGPFSHVALLGLDYRHSTSELNMGFGAAPPIDLYNPVYGASITFPTVSNHTGQKQDAVGLYVQDQIAFDKWRLTLSGRHDWLSTDTINYIKGTQQTQEDSAFSGRVGLNYVFDSGISPYVAYARSFQPTLGVSQSGTAFRPTTAEQTEIGVKYQPVGTNILLTAALFDITQQNLTTPDPTNPLFSVQTGEGRSRGVELEAAVSLNEGLKLIGSYTYTDMEVTKTNIPAQLGKQFVVMPRNQAALWADYTFQQGQFAGFGFGGGIRYIGDSYGDAANTILIPSYALFDATVHYDLSYLDPKLKGVKLTLNARNLFDKYYVASCTSLQACYLGAGREIAGSIRYTW